MQFQLSLLSTIWNSSSSDVNELSATLVERILNTLNQHAPFKEYKIFNNFKIQVWFTEEVMDMIKRRDELHKIAIRTQQEIDWNHYKTVKNGVTNSIRK